MRALARALAFSALLGACGSGETILVPPLSMAEESWIIGVVGAGETLIHASDRGAPPLRAAVGEGPVELELRTYLRPLADLQLTVGPVPPPASGTFPRPLPRGERTLVARLEDGLVGPWVERTLDPVAAFEYGVHNPCTRLTPEIRQFDFRQRVRWAVNLDAATVALATENYGPFVAEIVRIDKTGDAKPLRLDASEHILMRSGFLDAAGTMWVGTDNGGLFVGRFSEGSLSLTRRVASSTIGALWALDGDPADPEGQLFALTDEGVLARLEGDRLVTLARVESDPTRFDQLRARVVWLGRDDVLASNTIRELVYRWRAGQELRALRSDPRPNAQSVGVTGLAKLADGRVAVSGLGFISIYEDGRIESLGEGPLGLDAIAFHPLARGFLYAGASGYVGEWSEEFGFCALRDAPTASGGVYVARPLGERVLMTGEYPISDGNTTYALLSLQAP